MPTPNTPQYGPKMAALRIVIDSVCGQFEFARPCSTPSFTCALLGDNQPDFRHALTMAVANHLAGNLP